MTRSSLERILHPIPEERRGAKTDLMSPLGCMMADVLFLGTFLDLIIENKPSHCVPRLVGRSMAMVINKSPSRGEQTSLVVRSLWNPDLEGMIIFQNTPLRPMRNDCFWPSMEKYIATNESEGLQLAKLAKKLGFPGFKLDEPIWYLFPLVFEKLGIKVGPSFYENIKLFTNYMNGKE